jgi:TAT (twin-arginine translocation) pathway signal sequence
MRTTYDELARFLAPHPHRHDLSRRTFLKAGVAATAVIATSGVLSSSSLAKSAMPSPTPANPAFGGLHIYGVDPSMEPSAIADFHGRVGAAVVDGTGVWKVGGSAPETLLFDTDMRFMQGVFRATDGRDHKGTFAFV